MSKLRSADQEKALALLKAALGDFSPEKPLKRLISSVPDFGAFEWMLTIIGLEIDLRIDVPESLADDHNRTAIDFCRLVANLPKVDSPGYTLECLGLVAQALLSLEVATEPAKSPSEKLSAHKAPAQRAKTPRSQATSTKRATNKEKRSAAKARSTPSANSRSAGKRGASGRT